MYDERNIRTEMLLGAEGLRRLRRAKVAVFGLGGVGGHAAETLARCGVGSLLLVDRDSVSVSNLNRQIFAVSSTVGMPKVEAAARRLLDIAPDLELELRCESYLPDTAGGFDLAGLDYVIDAVDTVTAKLELAVRAAAAGTPIISCMGTGNKLDPTAFEVADISRTSVCPLARVMRRELKRRGIEHLKVVWSREKPLEPLCPGGEPEPGRRAVPGSVAFVPAAAGLILAGEVVKDIALK